MTSKSYPTPAYNSGALTETEYENLAVDGYMPSGLVGVPSASALVYADTSGMHVKFRASRSAIVRGQRWVNDSSDALVTVNANAGATRYDLATLRLDRTAQTVVEHVVQGTSGSGVPSPVQNSPGSGVWDFPVASIHVASGATTIAATDITPLGWYLGEPAILCTSTTRPPQRFGRQIREYNTGKVYVSDGTNWVLQGEDTDWVEFSASSGWTKITAKVRRRNGVVFMKFEVERTGGALATSTNSVMGQLPAGYWPSNEPVQIIGYFNGNNIARGNVGTNGQITLDNYGSLNVTTVSGKVTAVSQDGPFPLGSFFTATQTTSWPLG